MLVPTPLLPILGEGVGGRGRFRVQGVFPQSFALSLNPSPNSGRGTLSACSDSPSPNFGRRGWGNVFRFWVRRFICHPAIGNRNYRGETRLRGFKSPRRRTWILSARFLIASVADGFIGRLENESITATRYRGRANVCSYKWWFNSQFSSTLTDD